MSDLTPSGSPQSPGPDTESLGQYLRRVRIGNGIDLKKMSSDTRLGAETLTAVEKDDYKKIPGATYQKVFIKNIAKYLGLDPEKIYQRFLQEMGAQSPGPAEVAGRFEGAAGAPQPEGSKAPAPEPRPPAKGLLVLLSVLAGTLILVLLARRNLPAPEPRRAPPAETTDMAVETPLTEDSLADDQEIPAPAPAVQAPEPGLPVPEAQPDSTPVLKNRFSQEKRGALKVTVKCLAESCYLSAIRKGRPWNNRLRQGEYKTFASDSSMFFWIDTLASVAFSLNGAPLEPPGGRFSVGPAGVEALTVEAWKKMTERP